eukprot:UN0889
MASGFRPAELLPDAFAHGAAPSARFLPWQQRDALRHVAVLGALDEDIVCVWQRHFSCTSAGKAFPQAVPPLYHESVRVWRCGPRFGACARANVVANQDLKPSA